MLATLGTTKAIVSSNYAEDHDISVGDVLTLRSTADKSAEVTVVGNLRAAAVLPVDRERERLDRAVRLALRPPAQPLDVGQRRRASRATRTARRWRQAIAGFPDTQLETREEWIEREDADFNEFISFLYVMLTLAVFVSIFGMINTLVLSVYERTREIGMLRAIGMTRRQVRRMIRQESIITALIGAAIGLPLGIFLAALVNRALSEYDVRFAIPWGQLVVLTIVADGHRDPRGDHARAPRGEAESARGNRVRVTPLSHVEPAGPLRRNGRDPLRPQGILGRKLRTALTAVAIVLGVAMVSGTYVLTDSIDKAFDTIFTDIYRGTDATITRQVRLRRRATAPASPSRPFDESLLPEVRRLPEVADAIGGVDAETTQLVGRTARRSCSAAPPTSASRSTREPEFNSLTLVEGTWPGPNELVIDKSTARKEDLAVGETIGVQVGGAGRALRISGLVKFGSVSSIGGATLSGFDLPTAQRLFGKEGKLDQIVRRRQAGRAEELVSRDQEILPPGTQVQHR